MPSYSGVFTLQAQMQAIAAGNWTSPPGAPTIGTATAGDASASVTFTAPANPGIPASSLTYTVTSSPGGLTGTGASSPITVTGLTNGTSYTFTVTATNTSGTGAASAASNSVTPVALPTVIGQAYGGGFYAGQIGVSSVATHYLIVGPLSTSQFIGQWKTSDTNTAGTASVIDGPANTAAMIAAGAAAHPCGQFCDNLTVGGFTDWYMPAKNELDVCYFNLKPTTANNNTSSGINPNAVPARASNYTSGNPAQTSATAFQSGGAETFTGFLYWASNQVSSTDATLQYFSSGNNGFNLAKTRSYTVRAIRRIPV
jgi:hypothetical protein